MISCEGMGLLNKNVIQHPYDVDDQEERRKVGMMWFQVGRKSALFTQYVEMIMLFV